jgi:hypothetical protein
MYALRKRLDYLETEFSIRETICSSLSEWLETGIVDVNNDYSYQQLVDNVP